LSGAGASYVGSDRGGVADILYVLSTLEEGAFSVGPADGPDTPGWSVEDVMADVGAIKSLEGEVVDAGLFEAPGVRLVDEIDEAITLEPADWSVVVSLVQPFTFAHLEDRLGRGGAVRLLHTLHRLGVADTVVDGDHDDDDESEWLDKLADDIAPGEDEPTWIEAAVDEPVDEGLEPEPEREVEAPVDPAPPVSEETLLEVLAADEIDPVDVRGVSAPASTTLTDGVYDEIRRLRSKVAEK
jgi:hypothetical protein